MFQSQVLRSIFICKKYIICFTFLMSNLSLSNTHTLFQPVTLLKFYEKEKTFLFYLFDQRPSTIPGHLPCQTGDILYLSLFCPLSFIYNGFKKNI